MKKRLIALLLTVVLVIGTAATGASAAELTRDDMTEVLLAVKNKLLIGDEFTEFNYYYYQQSNGAVWDFDWNTADYKRTISVTCDEEAHIQRIYMYDYSESGQTIPVFTKDELLPRAEEYIARTVPEAVGHYRFKSASYTTYRSSYTYSFERFENGIPMPDNSLSLSVNFITGELNQLYCNWNYDVTIPAADIRVTRDEAGAKIGTRVSMELRYYQKWNDNGAPEVFLAYTPSTGYMAVDAVTGEIYDSRTYWSYGEEDSAVMAKSEAEADNAAGFRASLSEAELAEIDKLKDLISDEQAIAVIRNNKYLQLDETLNSVNATLQTSKDSYTWNIQMRDARPVDWDSDDRYRASAYATVDAITGKLLSFSASNKSIYYMTDEEIEALRVRYTGEECRQVFADFAKETDKEHFELTRLVSTYDTYQIFYDSKTGTSRYGGYTMRFDRYNEDVPFSNNYIYGSVSAVTGKVFDYSSYWTEGITFPSPATAITPAKAFEAYLGYDGFDLVYEIVSTVVASDDYYQTKTVNSVRLVYRTQISPAYVDAFTGRQLNYNGSEYVNSLTAYEYTDIKGHANERAIRLLADMGIGIEGREFKPDQPITYSEFYGLMDKCNNVGRLEDKDRHEGDIPVTRLHVVSSTIRALGYEKLARLQIFRAGYDDDDSIDDINLGFVALGKGLDIMGAKSGNNFKQYDSVTRGEAAEVILRMIGVAGARLF